MDSPFFRRPERRRARPRSPHGDRSVRYGLTLPASLKFTLEREAQAEGVTLCHLMVRGAEEFARQTSDCREKGLLPIPARATVEEIEAMRLAAARRGMSLTSWVGHVLSQAAAVPARDLHP